MAERCQCVIDQLGGFVWRCGRLAPCPLHKVDLLKHRKWIYSQVLSRERFVAEPGLATATAERMIRALKSMIYRRLLRDLDAEKASIIVTVHDVDFTFDTVTVAAVWRENGPPR